MATLAFARRGAGAPLVLLHGIGSSRRVWDPVLPALAERFDVLAVDLPGFGESLQLPVRVEPAPAALAGGVAGLLDELEITRPHLAGNSLGGWVALELARLRPVATVTLLSPAGLWRDRAPRYVSVSLGATRWLCRHATGLLCGLVDYRLGRILVLGQTHGRPAHMSPDQARTTIRAMGTCPGFEAALKASFTRHYQADQPSDTPVTVAFGSRDRLFPGHQARHLDQLPPDAQERTLPGCGHVPMFDAPAAVAALITASAGGGQRRTPEP